jgi:hypothetical protein
MTALEPVFLDGELLKADNFMDIRRRMHG